MISVSNVTMRYGSKILFEDVSTQFISGRRYGLTGPNGAGKSTFMKVLTGELEAQKGIVVRPRKLGILRQDQYAFDAYRVIDTVIMGNAPLWAALEERENLYNKAELTDEEIAACYPTDLAEELGLEDNALIDDMPPPDELSAGLEELVK